MVFTGYYYRFYKDSNELDSFTTKHYPVSFAIKTPFLNLLFSPHILLLPPQPPGALPLAILV